MGSLWRWDMQRSSTCRSSSGWWWAWTRPSCGCRRGWSSPESAWSGSSPRGRAWSRHSERTCSSGQTRTPTGTRQSIRTSKLKKFVKWHLVMTDFCKQTFYLLTWPWHWVFWGWWWGWGVVWRWEVTWLLRREIRSWDVWQFRRQRCFYCHGKWWVALFSFSGSLPNFGLGPGPPSTLDLYCCHYCFLVHAEDMKLHHFTSLC